MKVLMLNGSPHREGCTHTALAEVAGALNAAGVETGFFWLGTAPVHGCIACGKCKKTGACVFEDDVANALLQAILDADGLVIGSPVYYAGPNGALCAVLDRVFYAAGQRFAGKVCGCVASCRRGGSTAALDRLNKYPTYGQMPLATSKYWNMVHGNTPEEVRQDLEGMQNMRMLGQNMARLLLATQGVPLPEKEKGVYTNFIR